MYLVVPSRRPSSRLIMCVCDSNFLNSQGLGQDIRITTDNSSQTPASTAEDTSPLPASAAPPASRRIIFGLLALVAMLLGTNAYSHRQNRAWKVRARTRPSGSRPLLGSKRGHTSKVEKYGLQPASGLSSPVRGGESSEAC